MILIGNMVRSKKNKDISLVYDIINYGYTKLYCLKRPIFKYGILSKWEYTESLEKEIYKYSHVIVNEDMFVTLHDDRVIA